MKRLCTLMMLMLASSSVQAGTISFSVGGHRVRIEAPRGCSSSSCASISIPGVHESRRKRDDDTRDSVASSPPKPAANPAPASPAPAPPPVQQAPPPLSKPILASAPQSSSSVITPTAITTTQDVVPPPRTPLPPLPPVPQVEPVTVTQPCTAAEVRPLPPTLQVLLQEDSVDSPVGDWQTEGKGMIRIAECGRALCGYAIKEGEQDKGEAILINMKAKSDSQWNGSVYSKESGGIYYGTMRLRGPNTLRVEACAFGSFYCNGNNWSRVMTKPMVMSRQSAPQPRT